MNAGEHPDVVPYAQGDLPRIKRREMKAAIEQHLAECGECRDLALFIRKTNATLQYEGRVSRVAKALRSGDRAQPARTRDAGEDTATEARA